MVRLFLWTIFRTDAGPDFKSLTQIGPGFFITLKDRGGGGGGGGKAHRYNSCISSHMKLKLGSNIIWIMFISN